MAATSVTADQIRLGRERIRISTLPSALMRYTGHLSFLQESARQENASARSSWSVITMLSTSEL